MGITLCFDFGNTRLKCAVFNNRDLQEVIVLPDDKEGTIKGLVHSYHPDKSILSSVIEHDAIVEKIP